MNKSFKKVLYVCLIVSLIFTCFSCKKNTKHKWMEVGADPNPAKIEPGVHPERGSESNAIPIVLIPIYFPTGRDKEGVSQYKKYFYEMLELTPDNVDLALKEMGLIDESSLFCDLVISESDVIADAGPGASESKLTKKGTVRYVDLASPIDNSDSYEGKYLAKDLAGMIDQHDVEYCITATFQENFQLVSCDIVPVDYSVYKQVHGIK
ncbi:MAG: hypothetical protein J6P02_01500 [Lachnospiraceae bacterium]|nr:hypothetical protein [Lachnospiraceae bacterium]